MKVSRSFFAANKKYFWVIGVCLIIQILMLFVQGNSAWIEVYYSRKAYPIIAYLNKFLFSWMPFSVGDLFYIAVVFCLIISVVKFVRLLLLRKWQLLGKLFLQLLSFSLLLYTFFYVNWGLNYFREPLAISMDLKVESITKEDHLQVLEKYIYQANSLRAQIDFDDFEKGDVKQDVEEWMKQDAIFGDILSKTQVEIKQPISSSLISYFTVSGYFNPFTSEVQVNQEIPKSSYPFVNVHELAHQMGIGFEDDCNFVAFRELIDHPNLWYRYSAYYNAIQSLLDPIYADEVLFEKYKSMLSDAVIGDFKEESRFWQSYRGWIDRLSSVFYNGYLKHNNQPEGLERYNMMARLIVAWEKQQ